MVGFGGVVCGGDGLISESAVSKRMFEMWALKLNMSFIMEY